jgi:hypothetical protein
MKKQIFVIQIILCFVFIAGCTLQMQARTDQVVAGALGPEAWIDAPLDGMHLPMGVPYDVVFHITADTAVSRGELSINSGVVATLDNPNAGSNLATLHYSFTPPQPGKYNLQVRAQDSSNAWSDYFDVTVYVDEMTPSITPTVIPSITPTLISSITPTPTPTITPTVTQPVGPVFSNIRLSANIFYRLDAVPNKVTFTVKVDDPVGIKLVEIYFRLRDPVNSATTDWVNEDMKPGGGGMYTYTLSHAHPALTPTSPKTMTLEYQFIVTHPDLSLTRSPLYSDVTLQGP